MESEEKEPTVRRPESKLYEHKVEPWDQAVSLEQYVFHLLDSGRKPSQIWFLKQHFGMVGLEKLYSAWKKTKQTK